MLFYWFLSLMPHQVVYVRGELRGRASVTYYLLPRGGEEGRVLPIVLVQRWWDVSKWWWSLRRHLHCFLRWWCSSDRHHWVHRRWHHLKNNFIEFRLPQQTWGSYLIPKTEWMILMKTKTLKLTFFYGCQLQPPLREVPSDVWGT